MKSIWERIKHMFGKKPQGELSLPPKELNTKTTVSVEVLAKPKRTRKKKLDSHE
jgi:hypothetical protein